MWKLRSSSSLPIRGGIPTPVEADPPRRSAQTGARRSRFGHVVDDGETTSVHLVILSAWQSRCTLARSSWRATMSHCVCGHAEETHLGGGRCRVPGCICDRFWPVPEISENSAGLRRRELSVC